MRSLESTVAALKQAEREKAEQEQQAIAADRELQRLQQEVRTLQSKYSIADERLK